MGVYQRSIRSDELMHYGVIGMKWGVRRYQNLDGTLTAAGKKRPRVISKKPTKEDKKTANDIYNTLSDSDRRNLYSDNDYQYEYYKKNYGIADLYGTNFVPRQFVVNYGNVPVSLLDVKRESDTTASLYLMTRSGEEYRGKGNAQKAVKAGMKWFEKNNFENVYWDVREENTSSRKLAEKNGFELKPGKTSDGFITYTKQFKKNN